MKGDGTVWELVRVGAPVAANCVTCLKYHAAKAQEEGVDTELKPGYKDWPGGQEWCFRRDSKKTS